MGKFSVGRKQPATNVLNCIIGPRGAMVRLTNRFRILGIVTVGDLLRFSKSSIRSKNCGQKSVDYLIACLDERDLHLVADVCPRCGRALTGEE